MWRSLNSPVQYCQLYALCSPPGYRRLQRGWRMWCGLWRLRLRRRLLGTVLRVYCKLPINQWMNKFSSLLIHSMYVVLCSPTIFLCNTFLWVYGKGRLSCSIPASLVGKGMSLSSSYGHYKLKGPCENEAEVATHLSPWTHAVSHQLHMAGSCRNRCWEMDGSKLWRG